MSAVWPIWCDQFGRFSSFRNPQSYLIYAVKRNESFGDENGFILGQVKKHMFLVPARFIF